MQNPWRNREYCLRPTKAVGLVVEPSFRLLIFITF